MVSAADRRTLLLSGTGLGLLFAVILGMMSWQDYWHYSVLSRPAIPITFEELVRHEAGGSVHIRLTDFVFGTGYVFEESSGHWTKVFVPVFAKDDEHPSEILAVVESWDIADEPQLQTLLKRQEVSGILSGTKSEFGFTAGPLLSEANPGMALTEAWRIHFFETAPSLTKIRLSASGSILSLIAGCLCLWQRRRDLRVQPDPIETGSTAHG